MLIRIRFKQDCNIQFMMDHHNCEYLNLSELKRVYCMKANYNICVDESLNCLK